MTLILSITDIAAARHVSDRRVTLLGGTVPRVHSPVENKTIIFLCKDAIGVIGYTGVAYIGSEPTDQWIANVLAPQPAGPGLGEFAIGGKGLGSAKLQTLVWRLRNAVANAPLPLRARVLQIAISGYRIRRRRCLPFGLELVWNALGPKVSGLMRQPRSLGQRTIVGQIGDGFVGDELRQHVIAGAEQNREENSDALLRGMVHAVRARAAQTATVGGDVMTVLVPNPRLSRKVVWKFEPEADHPAVIEGRNFRRMFSAVYSPWIICPDQVSCPMVATGGLEMQSCGWSFACGNEDARIPDSGIIFASSHHHRTRRP
ncbi:hypothetical protein J3E64_001544 [Sphingobium sp. OAS761]|uniref:hypothetical protein n=1 Tax=Sphingobium sp. OAS761 TaxID=2817901 RepID=UPI0020A1B14A|nr:hypothetical protein [Sphingobium sp. OAS761]MCP1469862.1 hypothetical protein [Sphingobium sp. OAS761]